MPIDKSAVAPLVVVVLEVVVTMTDAEVVEVVLEVASAATSFEKYVGSVL